MNKFIITFLFLLVTTIVSGQVYFRDNQYIFKNKVSIGSQLLGSTPTDAWLMVGDSASTKAMVLPRMQNASTLATPRQGMLTYSIVDSSIYYWSLYNRYKLARINDILTYTGSLPVRVTGTVISVDTSVAFSPSLTTNARLIKVADSIVSLSAGGSWAITGNTLATTGVFGSLNDFDVDMKRNNITHLSLLETPGNLSFNYFPSIEPLGNIPHAPPTSTGFYIQPGTWSGLPFTDLHSDSSAWRLGTVALYGNKDAFMIMRPNQNGSTRTDDYAVIEGQIYAGLRLGTYQSADGVGVDIERTNKIWFRADSNRFEKRISYTGNIHGAFGPYSLVTKAYADSVAAIGGTPTLQQVITAGNSFNNNTLNVGEAGSIQFDIDNDAAYVSIFNQTNTDIAYQTNSTGNGFVVNWSALTGGTLKTINMPNFTTGDYYATIGLSNSWSDGVKQTFNPSGTNAGINVGAHTAAPSSLANGDLWYNSTSNELNARINGATVALGAGGGGVSTASLPLRISGSNVSADTSVANNPSLASNQRLQKIIDSLSGAGSLSGSVNNNDSWYQYHWDASGVTSAGFYINYSGAGSNITRIDGVADGWMSSYKWSLGTTTTGKTYGYMGNSGAILYGAVTSATRFSFRTRVRFEDLSNGTETYKFWFGFMDDHFTPPASLLDGAYFTYTHGESSGVFVAHTESNGTETTSATATTVAADTDYLLEVSIFGGSAYFYINKTLAATIATNVPSGTARSTTPEIHIGKSAGTTSRDIYLDKIAYGMSQY